MLTWPRNAIGETLWSLFWILLAYCGGLWLFSAPFTGDQKTYIAIAMEMRQAGQWFTPLLHGLPSYYKPPFQYWATLVGWKSFGFNLFGTFFPSVVALLGTAAFLDAIARQIHGAASKSRAGLWFAVAAGVVTYGTTAQMEIWIVFFYAAAWWGALAYFQSKKAWALFFAFTMAGMLSLVKSPLYSVLWVVGFWAYGGWRELKSIRGILAHLWGMGVGAWWYAAVLLEDGQRFWKFYVERETLQKTGGNGSSILHLWGDFSTFCLPYLLWAIPCVWVALRAKSPLRKLILAWGGGPALFFSVFPYRTETYLFPLVPLVALAVNGVRGPEGAWALANGLLVGVAVGILALLLSVTGTISPLLGAGLILCACVQLFYSWGKERRKAQRVVWAFLGIVFFVRCVAISIGASDLKGLREWVKLHPSKPVAFFDEDRYLWHEVGLLSAALGVESPRAQSLEELRKKLIEGYGIILTDGQWPKVLSELSDSMPLRVQPWLRWKRAFAVPKPSDLESFIHHPERRQREYRIIWL